jgi:hypothetical protein
MGINFHHYVVDAMIWKRRAALPPKNVLPPEGGSHGTPPAAVAA